MSVLLVVLLAVACIYLYRIAAGVEKLLAREPLTLADVSVPYGVSWIQRQRESVKAHWEKARDLSDELVARYGGRTLSDEEHRGYERDGAAVAHARAEAERERQYLDLMIQANARVLRGDELVSAAQARVFDRYSDRVSADLREEIGLGPEKAGAAD